MQKLYVAFSSSPLSLRFTPSFPHVFLLLPLFHTSPLSAQSLTSSQSRSPFLLYLCFSRRARWRCIARLSICRCAALFSFCLRLFPPLPLLTDFLPLCSLLLIPLSPPVPPRRRTNLSLSPSWRCGNKLSARTSYSRSSGASKSSRRILFYSKCVISFLLRLLRFLPSLLTPCLFRSLHRASPFAVNEDAPCNCPGCALPFPSSFLPFLTNLSASFLPPLSLRRLRTPAASKTWGGEGRRRGNRQEGGGVEAASLHVLFSPSALSS